MVYGISINEILLYPLGIALGVLIGNLFVLFRIHSKSPVPFKVWIRWWVYRIIKKGSWKREIGIQSLMPLWKKEHTKKERIIYVDEMAELWRTNGRRSVETNRPEFKSQRLEEFWERYIEVNSFIGGPALKVLQKIMEILDTHGHCSSIVGGQNEPEGSQFQANVFDTLSKVTLLDHTVNVAEIVCAKMSSGPSATKALIAAFAHDIGKLPIYRDDEGLYKMGDHPLISNTIIERIPAFHEIPYAADLKNAIRMHHRNPRETDRFAWILKEADGAARVKELSKLAAQTAQAEQAARNSESQESATPSGNSPAEKPVAGMLQKQEPAPAIATGANPQPPQGFPPSLRGWGTSGTSGQDMFGNAKNTKGKNILGEKVYEAPKDEGEVDRVVFSKVDLSWFEPMAFLNDLFPLINRPTGVSGKGFSAFSMPNGCVYIQINPVWQALKKQADLKNVHDVAVHGAIRDMRLSYLLAAVEELKAEGMIMPGHVGDGFISGRYQLTMRDKTNWGIGGPDRIYKYVPITAEAFEKKVSELESLKIDKTAVNDIMKCESAIPKGTQV